MRNQRVVVFFSTAILFALAGCSCGGGNKTPDGGTDGGLPFACLDDLTDCSGVCVRLAADNANCGACGNNCGVGRECVSGACERKCDRDAGEIPCGNYCLNALTDNSNCGGCGVSCSGGQSCVQGVCTCPDPSNELFCAQQCTDVRTDSANCGTCGTECDAGYACTARSCQIVCDAPTSKCGPDTCADLTQDMNNCGQCGVSCPTTAGCFSGQCLCLGGKTLCGTAPNWSCTSLFTDNNNCGACGNVCPSGQSCVNGTCELPCPTGLTRCGNICVNTNIEPFSCGGCTNACTGATACDGGSCVACDSNTTDCDGDGWLKSEGDCCDTPADCAIDPKLVNPGALELVGNNVDDNCNGLLDSADVLDTQSCDTGLQSDSTDGGDYAAALGLCRTTTLNPATPQQRTWGVISAQLLRVDGTPLPDSEAASIRPNFGSSFMPSEGQNFVVISSGIAADATQTNPGPNGGPTSTQSNTHGQNFNTDGVSISSCASPDCVHDWFSTANPPLKPANDLPSAPGCTSTGGGGDMANDSVMLVLKLRAPTNVRSFSFKGLFLSVEYPEFVCTDFNDQLIALVTTPNGSPVPVPNPPDLNLMTYTSAGQKWPIGINIAKGTDLFKLCETPGTNPSCDDMNVSSSSCSAGVSQLAGTGFESSGAGACAEGGGTGWLSTSGNVVPGQIVELRIGIWDVGDDIYDSTALLDNFKWSTQVKTAGTE